MGVNVGFDRSDGLKVCGIDVGVGNFDAALFFKQGDKIHERKTIERSDLKEIVAILRWRRAIVTSVLRRANQGLSGARPSLFLL